MSGWLTVDLTLPAGATEMALDVLSGALFEAGASGIETRDATKPVVLSAAFAPDTDRSALPGLIEGALEEAGLEDVGIQIKDVEPVDWSTHWRRHFKAMPFGPLWVVPSWLEAPAGARHVLRLDPGMAFGTGSHETTALCLERIAELSPVAAILDVGTGTGILAMGALLLGAKRAVGTDNDPEAITVARENAIQNGLMLELFDHTPDEKFPLVVANILAQPLIDMAPELAKAVAPGGKLILSGLLVSQAEPVAEAYEEEGLIGRVITTRGEWARVDLSRA